MSRRRLGWSLVAAVSVVALLASQALAATWSARTTAADQRYVWNYGGSMEVTSNGQIQGNFSTDYVKGVWASDSGPYQSTYHFRSKDEGATWIKSKRVSQGKKHDERSALTVAGNNVYVVWVTQKSYDSYDPTQPRQAFWKANPSSGAKKMWGPNVKLTPGKGQVDYPVIAASGSNVWGIWTNSKNGKMTFATSTDNGATLTKKVVGTTTRDDTDDPNEGKGGWPGICADGNNVSVGWLANNAGKAVAITSTDGGSTFSAERTLAAGGGGDDAGANHSWPQCSAEGSKVLWTWTNESKVRSELWTSGGSWQGAVDVYSLSGTWIDAYGPAPAIAPNGTTVGIGFTGCKTAGCDYYSNTDRAELLYAESTDSGSTWGAPQLLQDSGAKAFRINDGISVAWKSDSSKRYITFNGWNAGYQDYRLYWLTGT